MNFKEKIVYLIKLMKLCRLDPIKVLTIIKVRRHTMTDIIRLSFSYSVAKSLKVAGDIVEIGCCKGGWLAAICKVSGRKGWGFDAFSMVKTRYPLYRKYFHTTDDVRVIFNKLGIRDYKVCEGWFEDTIPKADIKKIAILRLDCNHYESTKYCLEKLYDKVVKGGFIFVDDYVNKCPGVTKAVNEFINKRKLRAYMNPIGKHEIWWKK